MRGGSVDTDGSTFGTHIRSASNRRTAADQIVNDDDSPALNISVKCLAAQYTITPIFLEKSATNRNRQHSTERTPKIFGSLNATGIRRNDRHFAGHLDSCKVVRKKISCL